MLISGASSGIGRATALRLAAAGFEVFAGVRRREDGESLRAEARERIRPVTLDVTDAGSIVETAAAVHEATGDAGLAGLVNNAGISRTGPLEFIPVEGLREQLEVNVVGQVAVTQALLPAIRRARGRIVNMGSVGGRVAHPFLAPYHASKFAIEAVTESLRKELRPWGIQVVVIEPGSIKTPIWEKGRREADAQIEALPLMAQDLYGRALRKVAEVAWRTGENGRPPEDVAKVVERALTARRPRTRYVVGGDARVQLGMGALLPDRTVDAIEARFLGTS